MAAAACSTWTSKLEPPTVVESVQRGVTPRCCASSIDGEKLPGVEPQHWQAPSFVNHIDPTFAVFVLFVFGGIMLKALGALLGATVTGGVVGVLAWYISGSFAAAFLATVVVFLVWLWLSHIAVLLGLEFNVELDRDRAAASGPPADAPSSPEPRAPRTHD